MTTKTVPEDRAAARRRQRLSYTLRIEQICREDPGARSALRSGLRRNLDSVPRMHRLIAPRLPKDSTAVLERAYYAIAAMIADQPRSDGTQTTEPDTDPDLAAETVSGPDTDAEEPISKAGSARPDRYGTSLGTAFALAVTGGPGREREMRRSTAERRLNLLTRQSLNGLHRHLPASVRYLRSLGVPVDWAQLLDDLIAWPAHSGRISRRWLQDFYRLCGEPDLREADEADQQEAVEPAPQQ